VKSLKEFIKIFDFSEDEDYSDMDLWDIDGEE
jgi:hypothetical protein